MPSLMATAILGGAAISGVGAAVSGGEQASAAKSAAATQANASNIAQANTMAMFNKTQANLAPFISGGTAGFNALTNLTGTGPGGNPLTAPLTAPFQPTMAQLAQTPGYQFTLGQGELATQNSFAAQGLGSSGAAAKGAANYAENLASTTFQNQFQNYLTQNSQIYSMLSGVGTTGENAAAGQGSLGMTATGQAGAYGTAAAAAQAAGTVGSANAISNAITSGTGGINNAAMMLALNNNSGLFSGGSTPNFAGIDDVLAASA